MMDVLLLELEGVLVDTHSARRAALITSLSEEGVVIGTDDYDEIAAGLPLHAAAARLLASRAASRDATSIELIALRAERAFAESIENGATLFPGARALIADAHGRARLALVTRARRSEAQFLLALAGVELAFESVITADDVFDPKPDAASYAVAIARLDRRRPVDLGACVAVEDAVPGIQAAHGARVRCIAVGSIAAHRALEADAYVASLAGQTVLSLRSLVTPVSLQNTTWGE